MFGLNKEITLILEVLNVTFPSKNYYIVTCA